MRVKFNNEEIELADGTTLAGALESRGVGPKGIATAVNGEVVGADSRPSTTLRDGDTILVIKAFYGG